MKQLLTALTILQVLADDHYNAIQRWVIRKKIPKQELIKYIEEDMILTDSIERIPSAVEELQRMVK